MTYKKYFLIAAILMVSVGVGYKVLPEKAVSPSQTDHAPVYRANNEEPPAVPIGYSRDEYDVAEVTTATCVQHSDCTTPTNYLIRSSCPYTSLCLQNRCAVICPRPLGIRLEKRVSETEKPVGEE